MIEADVNHIITTLRPDEVRKLHDVACGLNSDNVPCPYDVGMWTARGIVRAIAERVRQHFNQLAPTNCFSAARKQAVGADNTNRQAA